MIMAARNKPTKAGFKNWQRAALAAAVASFPFFLKEVEGLEDDVRDADATEAAITAGIAFASGAEQAGIIEE